MSNIFTVTLPDIGEGVVEGEVIEWLKNVGDPLMQDEAVVTVMTDKATVELPAPYPGKLAKQYYKAGEISIKDQPLYDIDVESGIEVCTTPSLPKKESSPKPSPLPIANKEPSPASSSSTNSVQAAPPVRKLAKDLGIDINHVPGTGKHGRITKEDLQNFLSQTASATPIPFFEGDEEKPLQGIRRLVAQKMSESKKMVPHFSFFDSAKARNLIQLKKDLSQEAARQNIKLSYMPFFIRALSLCLKEFSQFNSSVDPNKNAIILHKPHNIGIAMKTPLGLIVPVLKNIHEKNFKEIAFAYDDLRQRALSNQLKPQEMKESTITISNFGTEGGLWATPVINYPEVAILATAKIQKQAVVRNDEVVIRSLLNCSWSFDHRIIDGDMAASFSKTFISLIESPSQLIS